MVRVLQCHHFASQDVFTTDNEPHAVHVAAGMAFVATDQCYIEVHSLNDRGCPKTYQFPTVARVKQLVYSKPDDFIATLEEKPTVDGLQSTVRVYIQWRSDLSQQPMRASIAGHMTSLRHDVEDLNRFEVIEIPLKGDPRCICIDPTFGTLGIGIGSSLLVYGFCTKTVAETKVQYREVKCLLHLDFKFKIRQVALCEDYLACSSNSEFQVVKLKDPICPGPDVGDCPAFSKPASPSNPKTGDNRHVGVSKPDTSTLDLPVFINQKPHSPIAVSQVEPVSASILTEAPADLKHGHDEPSGNSVLQEQGDPGVMQKGAKKKPPVKSVRAIRKIMLKGLATVKGRQTSEVREENGIILGPVDNPYKCAVSVEYENVCNPSCNMRNHVLNGVTTCLYQRFQSSLLLHSLQLNPVYLHGGHTRAEERGRRCGMFCPISNHGSLVGMSVFISSDKSGYLYNVHGRSEALATYPYTNTAKQVSVGEQMLYAVTKGGLEIYTTRCLAAALRGISPMDNVTNALPGAELEPCLVGIQPFIGAQSVSATAGRVVLLSKYVSSSSEQEEVNWSLYSLQCDTVCNLYKDMMELGEEHWETNPLSRLHLLKEGHVLLRGHQFKHGTNDIAIHHLICQSAALLADHFMSTESDEWKLALPYALISGLSIGEVIYRALRHGQCVKSSTREASLKDDTTLGRGLRLYLDYMLFRQENPLLASQSEGDLVLSMYAELDPSKLSTVILHSTLNSYSDDKALKLLQERMESSANTLSETRSVLDRLCVTELHLRLGHQDKAEEMLLSMSEEEVMRTCREYPWLFHDNLSKFSHLAQVFRKHKEQIFINILVALVQQGALQLDSVIKLLQGQSKGPVHTNSEIRELLEKILSDDGYKRFFMEAGRKLIDVYLECLDNWKPPDNNGMSAVTISDVIPKGNGHFMKRFYWLNHLPPFTGANSLEAPCSYTRKSSDPKGSVSVSRNPQLEAPQANTPQLNASQSDTPQPDTPQPDTPQPNTPQPNTPQPDTPQPNTPQPNTPQPNTPQPNTPQPDTPQPDTPQPDTPQPDTPQPDTPQPDTPQPNTPQPDTAQPDTPQPDAPQSHLGSSESTTPSEHGLHQVTDCTCCRCNAELLKLQSLLCSRYMPHESVRHVLSRIKLFSHLRGRDALRALCLTRLNPTEAIDMLTDNYVHLVTMFASEMLGPDKTLWSHVVGRMVTKLKPGPSVDDIQLKPELVKTFKRLLADMAEVLPPADFIPMLPPDGSARFFLPFIESSHQNHQAQKLENL